MFTKREQKELNRLKKSGRDISHKQSDAKFKLLIRPFTTLNVDVGNIATWFEDEMFAAIQNADFTSSITGIAIFPSIVDESIAKPPPGYITYKKKDNSISVSINIEFQSWTYALPKEKIGLMADNIRCSIDLIKNRYLSERDREELYMIIDRVQASLASRL